MIRAPGCVKVICKPCLGAEKEQIPNFFTLFLSCFALTFFVYYNERCTISLFFHSLKYVFENINYGWIHYHVKRMKRFQITAFELQFAYRKCRFSLAYLSLKIFGFYQLKPEDRRSN